MEMEKKICTHCKLELSIDMFGKIRKDSDKRRAICKPCAKAQKNEYRRENVEHRENINKKAREKYSTKVVSYEKREKMRAYQKERYEHNKMYLKPKKNIEEVNPRLKERKCAVCGTIFTPVTNANIYCNEECLRIGRRNENIAYCRRYREKQKSIENKMKS